MMAGFAFLCFFIVPNVLFDLLFVGEMSDKHVYPSSILHFLMVVLVIFFIQLQLILLSLVLSRSDSYCFF